MHCGEIVVFPLAHARRFVVNARARLYALSQRKAQCYVTDSVVDREAYVPTGGHLDPNLIMVDKLYKLSMYP
jgi:hypothetical protein